MNFPFVVVYSPAYAVDIGVHVFRTDKYRLIMSKLGQVMELPSEIVLDPKPATREEMLLALDEAYYDDLIHARLSWRTISSEIPISREIVRTAFLCAGGTVLAAREALRRRGVAYHIGGGWHHAFPDHAEGFCYVNDVALAILALRSEGKIRRAMVIDVDLHQGNGTAVYFQEDPDVFTFSMHQEQLYPIKRRSDLDVGLNNFIEDETYLRMLKSAIPRIIDQHQPDIVLYVAGADPYKDDQLGSLSLTMEGLRLRDAHVLAECAARQIPVAITLAGGYALDMRDTVRIHVNTAIEARQAAERYSRVELKP